MSTVTMSPSVEILVRQDSLKPLRDALDVPSWARFCTAPSKSQATRLVLDSFDLLRTADALDDLDALRRVAQHPGTSKVRPHVPVVIYGTPGSGKTAASGLLVGALLHWFRRAVEEPYVATDAAAFRRVLLARRNQAEKVLIASAAIEGTKLVVWSCEPRRFEVPVATIPALARMTAKALKNFEVSTSGSRIHWPDGDVDLNLDAIREQADPKVRDEHDALRRKEAARYADAIRSLREERGIKQADMGLSERQVRRLEQGETIPHSSTLKKLALAHQMSVEGYLGELAKRSGVRRTSAARRPKS